jgi:hypothetical protein
MSSGVGISGILRARTERGNIEERVGNILR